MLQPPGEAGQGGFTLLELLVVIAVLGALSGVAVFSMGAIRERAARSECAVDERALVNAQEAHAATAGGYTDEDGLVAEGLLRSPSILHDLVLSGDTYSVVPVGECSGGGELAIARPSSDARAPSTTTTTTTTTVPRPTMSRSAITSVRAVNLSTNKWRSTATVRVTDDLDAAVGEARVSLAVQQQGRTGNWTALASVSGVTDATGVVVVSSPDVNKYPVPAMRFRVTSVVAGDLTWQGDGEWSQAPRP